MGLTVLNVAYPFAPVGPNAVGGAEQVLHSLDAGLVRRGHHSMVVACEGSEICGEHICTPRFDRPGDCRQRRAARECYRSAICSALRSQPIDLVHMHGFDFHEYLPAHGAPVLITLHLPPLWYPHQAWRFTRPDLYLNCVSQSQQRTCRFAGNFLPVIENGIAVERFARAGAGSPASATGPHSLAAEQCSPRTDDWPRRSYALALGRICPEKNFHQAIDAARAAGVSIALAGAVFGYPEHEEYFLREIQPRLGKRARFLGPLALRRKRRLLQSARCLLAPSVAPETSSLVVMEALASGTPVVAFRSGALPELVEDGITGFVVDHVGQMAHAIGACERIDPRVCHDVARKRFSQNRMIDKYLDAYGSIVQRRVRTAPLRESTAHAARPNLVAEAMTSLASLEALEPQWWTLWQSCPDRTPFQSPAWALPWWRHFGVNEADLLVLAAFEIRGGARELVALLPLHLRRERGSRLRQLLPLGIGTSDYLNALVRPGCEHALCDLFSEVNARTDWDEFVMPQVPRWSLLFKNGFDTTGGAGQDMIESSLSGGFSTRSAVDCAESEPCPVLHLPRELSALAQCSPPAQLHRFRYERRRAQRLGVESEPLDAARLHDWFSSLCELHQRRWAVRGERGVLHDERVQRMHRDVIPALHQRGLLRMSALRMNGRRVAVLYGFADAPIAPNRVCYYLSGFDPALHHLSLGTILVGNAIESAVQEQAGAFDFLRGTEAYKSKWGAHNENTIELRWFRDGLARQQIRAIGNGQSA